MFIDRIARDNGVQELSQPGQARLEGHGIGVVDVVHVIPGVAHAEWTGERVGRLR